MLTRRTVIKGGALVAGAAAVGFGWPEPVIQKTTLRFHFPSYKLTEIPARLSVDRGEFLIKVERQSGDTHTATARFRLQTIREIVAGPPYNGKRPCSAIVRDEYGHVRRDKFVSWKDGGNLVFQTEGDTPIWLPLADVRKVL